MAFPQFTKDMRIISMLEDEPNDVGGLSATELKGKWDEGGQALKQYINETLLAAIDDQGAAGNIGAEDKTGGASTVQDELEKLKNLDGITATPAELNQLHESGVEKADIEKLHAVEATAAELDDAADKKHTHENKTVLDAIIASVKAGYDALVTMFSNITGVVTTLGNDNTTLPTSKAVRDAIAGSVSGVAFFNGRTGNVMPESGDYTAAMVGARPNTWNPSYAFAVTLTAAGWADKAQTIGNALFVSDGYTYTVSPADSSFADYAGAAVRAQEITVDGSCTFVCETVPTDSLTVNILRTEVVL